MDLELRSLRSEVALLKEQLLSLRERVSTLEAEREFEVVREEPAPAVEPPTSSAAASASSATEVGTTSGYPAVRVEAAKETGRFFLRCLGGGNRGLSGRERVQLPNRIYVLIRDIEGKIFTTPVKVFKSYNQLHPHVKRGQSLGDSVFAGFPSKWEASLAVETPVTPGLKWSMAEAPVDASAEAEDFGGIDGEPIDLSAYTVLQQGGVDPEYSVCHFSFTDRGGSPQTSQIILVALHQKRFLVAVPFAIWRRSSSRRLLPEGALSRVVSLALISADPSDRSAILPETEVKCWLGFASEQVIAEVVHSEEIPADLYHYFSSGDPLCLPVAKSLEDAAKSRFGVQWFPQRWMLGSKSWSKGSKQSKQA